MNHTSNRISVGAELSLQTKEAVMVLFGEVRNLCTSLLFPVIAAFITIWIAGEDMFNNMEATKSACFTLVCAGIWGGLFNSIQVVVKERPNIKRDYVSGALRIECYIVSRALVQMALCAFQSLVLCLSIPGIHLVYDNTLPEEGILFASAFAEYYVTVFLIMVSSDALGLMISCMVKSEQLAIQMSPYILIVQLLFSNVLFELKGIASTTSAGMISRWGMEALGSTSDLNLIPSSIAEEVPLYAAPFQEAFEHTADHLYLTWGVLVFFIVLFLAVGDVLLHRVSKDSRE